MKITSVIAGFPGVGKSTLFRSEKYKVSDSDSSKFDKKDFPNNYIEHIKFLIESGEYDYILVSTHKEVLDAMEENGIVYSIVVPSLERKEEFLEAYKNRGNTKDFIELLTKNWELWINDIMKRKTVIYRLKPNAYLKDVILKINRTEEGSDKEV